MNEQITATIQYLETTTQSIQKHAKVEVEAYKYTKEQPSYIIRIYLNHTHHNTQLQNTWPLVIKIEPHQLTTHEGILLFIKHTLIHHKREIQDIINGYLCMNPTQSDIMLKNINKMETICNTIELIANTIK